MTSSRQLGPWWVTSVVSLSSIAHKRAGMQWDDIQFERTPYQKWAGYGQAKTANSLFALGLLYISLTWGLILLGEPGNSGVAWLGTHMLIIIAALALHSHNRFTILKKW